MPDSLKTIRLPVGSGIQPTRYGYTTGKPKADVPPVVWGRLEDADTQGRTPAETPCHWGWTVVVAIVGAVAWWAVWILTR